MPKNYFDTDVRSQFSAPQFTITRHRYRGTRESEKVNLELNQLLFSIASLYERYSDIFSTIDEYAKELYVGEEEENLEGFNEFFTETFESRSLALEGLRSLVSRVQHLMKRVENLED